MERRLAAILAADVVDYSRLMGADETGTLAALHSFREELLRPAVAGHRGKIIKSMGDGWLIEFPTVVEAVNCALQIQDRLIENETLSLRMGIQIGDVVSDGDDIFGDSINVAARLESFTEPGSIAISDAVFGSLDGILRPSFDDAGAQSFKNIERQIRVWKSRPGIRRLQSDAVAGEAITGTVASRPRLAIRTISTSDDRPEVRELADSLTNDLESHLQGITWLSVATKNSPGGESYVLQATLRAREQQIRLDVHLLDSEDVRLWSEKFDGDLGAAFDWQDAVGEEVVTQVLGIVVEQQKDRLANLGLEQMTAEECELFGSLHRELVDEAAVVVTLRYAAAAIEKRSDFADAYALAIFTFLAARAMGFASATEPHKDAYRNWLAAGETYAAAHPTLDLGIGLARYSRERDETDLLAVVQRTLRRSRTDIATLLFSGWTYVWLGRPQEAIDCLERVLRLARFSPWSLPSIGGLAIAHIEAGRYEAAVNLVRRGLEVNRSFPALYRASAAANAQLGRLEEAKQAISELFRVYPGDTISSSSQRGFYVENEQTKRYFDGLRLAGLPP
jgi:adenylate cyclase